MLSIKPLIKISLIASIVFAIQSTFALNFSPKVGFTADDNQLFPSYIISNAGNQAITQGTANNVTEISESPDGLIAIELINDASQSVKIEVSAGEMIKTSSWEGQVEKDKAYIIRPLIDWNYNYLNKLNQPTVVNIEYKLYADSKLLASKKAQAKVRTINDVAFGYVKNNQFVSLADYFAAYVNENHPWIDSILQEALKTKQVQSFSGYQSGDPQDVTQQVFAIWNVMQKMGFKYSSITTSSGSSSKIYSQSVRFLDQSLKSNQANCVDGTVLFASILYKIGITPFLVLEPGHMYLSYFLDSKSSIPAFLETTAMGTINVKDFGDDSKVLGAMTVLLGADSQNSASVKSFNMASEVAHKRFFANKPNYQQRNVGYTVISIKGARDKGINPINFISE